MLLSVTSLVGHCVKGLASGRGEQVATCPQIVTVPDIAPLSPHSFGLRIYFQLVQFFKGGRAGMDGKREGAWGGVSYLVGSGGS